ncbi:MAG TPA: ABC transporter ATP-binding protein [Bacteroidales bacterium]|nr:ABC transporter ATP-binding protein [Bacteroidales bacterium]HSA42726.1 ABC transporter ATP-binding protein [Bacteroidales bacterium]
MIKAGNIHKAYGSLQVLKGINLTVEEGEIVSVIGASGAGKSTLLHILGTLDKPDKGSLLIRGMSPEDLSEKKLARFRNTHIGFVFQFHYLLPEFTALENVAIPAMISGKPRKQAEAAAMKLLERLELPDRADHKPEALSGGEQQRVAVARALINNPAVVLADEPSGNLDSVAAKNLHRLFFELRDERKQTFVIVTHNMELAEMANRMVSIKDGLII